MERTPWWAGYMPLNIVVMHGMVIELALIRWVKRTPRSARAFSPGVWALRSESKTRSARRQSMTTSKMFGLVTGIRLTSAST